MSSAALALPVVGNVVDFPKLIKIIITNSFLFFLINICYLSFASFPANSIVAVKRYVNLMMDFRRNIFYIFKFRFLQRKRIVTSRSV